VFFFWGFVAAGNSILIGIFKQKFDLNQQQSQYVDLAFYAAYFVGSLVYFFISAATGDPLNKIGYKKGLMLGLIISAIGAFGFIPAANQQSFELMLISLFVVGLGFALQQIVANPYVIALGNPSKGSHRVSFAGGINSFGTTIAPLLISLAIYGSINEQTKKTVAENLDISSVMIPYVTLGIAFLVFAAMVGLSKLPAIKNEEKIESGLGALRYPQLLLGMLAIFCYVGGEVAIASNLQEFLRDESIMGLEKEETTHLVSLYWGSLMIGRWTQGVSVFNFKGKNKTLATIITPCAAFGIIVGINYLLGSPLTHFVHYLPFVGLIIGAFLISAEKPVRSLLVFSLLGFVCMLAGIFITGEPAALFIIAGGLFCSILWPCIFSVSIAGLGKYTNQGSSLLIMMILGGALIPVLQGNIADHINIQVSYWVSAGCFAYLVVFGILVKNILIKQGINYDEQVGSGN
jgi:FHS family L-fucose permease-like MFS transporter